MNSPPDPAPFRPRRLRIWMLGVAGAAVLAVGAMVWQNSHQPVRAQAQAPRVPVTITQATQQDVPIYLSSLGTVQASQSVAMHSQIDGRLQSVDFKEGQMVHRGDTLAEIDSRALKAALEQAVAHKAQDQAQLVAAQNDLKRFKDLAKRDFETQQNVDQQTAKVDQLNATIAADQAAIDAAQTQLSYATITAPIDGRIGFRQVDAGNIIHANDPNPLTVITEIEPANVTFTLPQKNLAAMREAMLRGAVPVTAFDQDTGKPLADGQLLLVDNQIDQTTSTIKLKATFPNTDDRLWPGEFVRIRAMTDTRKGVVTIPQNAVQRGPEGVYAWVIGPDSKAIQRTIEVTQPNDQVAIVTNGLSAGDRVVVNGQYRLQPGALVDAKAQGASAPDKAS